MQAMQEILAISLEYNSTFLNRLEQMPDTPTVEQLETLSREISTSTAQAMARMQKLISITQGQEMSSYPGYDEAMSAYRKRNLVLDHNIQKEAARITWPEKATPQRIELAVFRHRYKDEAMQHRDTQRQMEAAAQTIRRLLAEYVNILSSVKDPASALSAAKRIGELREEYTEASTLLYVYCTDDPKAGTAITNGVQAEFNALQETIVAEERRILADDFYGVRELRDLYNQEAE